jgi:hypothetical protein
VQHHAFQRFARACAGARPAASMAPQGPPCAAASSPRCSPTGNRVAHQVLVEMLHVPAPIHPTIKVQHQLGILRRNAFGRRCPAVGPRAPQGRLTRTDPDSAGTAAPTSPSSSPASIIDKSPRSQRLSTSRNFCNLRSCRHAVRFNAPLLARQGKPDNSCAT